MPASVFLSYCDDEGLDYALRLQKILQSKGHSTFVAKPSDNPGNLGWSEIGKEIVKRDAMIVITTDCTYESLSQKIEYNLAINTAKPFFAFVLGDSKIPEILMAPNYVRFMDEDFDDKGNGLSPKIEELVKQRKKIVEQPSKETTITYVQTSEGLYEEAVEKYKQTMIKTYLQYAVVRHICRIGEFDPKNDDGKPFFQVPLKTRLPKEWFTEEDYSRVDSSMVFYRFGQEIAWEERNFFRGQLLEQVGKKIATSKDDISFDFIKSHATDMRKKGFAPDVLLAPIDYYVQMGNWFDKDRNAPCLDWTQRPERLTINNEISLKIYWSNNYAPLYEFILMDSNMGIWYVKPDPETGMAITVQIGISKLYPDEVEVLCKTVAKYTLSNPESVRIISLSEYKTEGQD